MIFFKHPPLSEKYIAVNNTINKTASIVLGSFAIIIMFLTYYTHSHNTHIQVTIWSSLIFALLFAMRNKQLHENVALLNAINKKSDTP